MYKLRYLQDIVTLELDVPKCNGCGMCIEVCPHAVFVTNNGTVSPTGTPVWNAGLAL